VVLRTNGNNPGPDVILGGEKGLFNLQNWLESRADDQFEVAAITIAELWHGVERASAAHRSSRQAYLESLITVLPIIRYTEHTAYVHARLWAGLETSGKNIGPYGPIVAATALQRGSTLATFKQTPLLRVKGLQLIEPKKSA
jgi:predicted nucleic acid-binding protein